MMKKVKKIPKYNTGGPVKELRSGVQIKNAGTNMNLLTTLGSTPKPAVSTTGVSGGGGLSAGNIASGIGNAATSIASAMGIEQTGVSAAFNVAGDIAGMIPGVGTVIGAGLKTIGAFSGGGGSVDENTGEITKSSGLTRLFGWGRSDASLKAKSSRIKSSNIAREQTQDIQADYYNNPNVEIQPNVLAAEGGVIRRPVDALVSKGELIYNPETKELTKVPGSKGKPNKADDVYTRLYEGDVVVSNSPTMLMANGKTPAQNLENMVTIDKKKNNKLSEGTVKAREAIIKKVVNWQEANKTKPQEYAKFDGGGIAGINKYGYNKNMSDFAYWDKDKNEYKKEYLDWVNNLTEQDVRDIESGKYGDMSEYLSKNKGKKLDVATAQKLMTDKKYGNWHKIGQAVVDNKIKTTEPKLAEPWQAKMSINGVGPLWQDMYKSNYPIDYTVTPIDMDLKKLPNPSAAEGSKAARKQLSKQGKPNWLNVVSDFVPTLSALFRNYDYHTEQPIVSPAKYLPTGVSIDPIRRAADESYAMARYNQANISPNTGAGMAYGLQAASNRAKTLADAYTWQQDAQNKLIAQNAGIYNDWTKRYDAARYQAIADTRANEGAAQQMRDQTIKDAYEFQTGRRNDRWKLSMLEPLMKYAVDDNIWKNFKIV